MSISQVVVVAKESNEVWAESRKNNLLHENPRSRAIMYYWMQTFELQHTKAYSHVYRVQELKGGIFIR